MLKVKDLKVKFKTQGGYFEAVKGISFTLKKGETIGIVGESAFREIGYRTYADAFIKRGTNGIKRRSFVKWYQFMPIT